MLRAKQYAMRCMAGISEIFGADPSELFLRVKICCPRPEELLWDVVCEPLHFYPKRQLELVAELGGAAEEGLHVPQMGDGNTIVVANAIITVFLETFNTEQLSS